MTIAIINGTAYTMQDGFLMACVLDGSEETLDHLEWTQVAPFDEPEIKAEIDMARRILTEGA